MTTSNEHNNAPAVPDGLQWFTVAEHGIPEIGAEVIGGLWYTDPLIKTEFATTFMWGQCRVVESKHRDFKDGKQWCTFGPSHNQITHWARINTPGQTSAPAPAVPEGWRDFLTELSKQKPEKPDYWSSCGQCERNSSTAEDLIAATPAPAPAQEVEPIWPLRAKVWKRESTQEWVLDIDGTLGSVNMTCRHTQPLSVAYEDVPGLPALYQAEPQEVGLTDEEIEAIAKKHMSTVGDHWCNEEAIREIHAEDFARDIIAALRAKGHVCK